MARSLRFFTLQPVQLELGLPGGAAHFGGGGGAPVGGGGGRKHHCLHFLQQDEQLGQLLLWQALVLCGDGVKHVFDNGRAVEGDGEAVGAVFGEGWVEVGGLSFSSLAF